MGVVIIPSDYEQLSEANRRAIVPIYIESEDRYGKQIDPAWFEKGVKPIHRELTELAGSMLGDKRMVSDIAQPSVHKVWYRHGDNMGEKPHGRIWRQAVWEARDLAAGGWRERKFRVVNRTLEELDREFPTQTVDRHDYATVYHRRILLGSIKKTLQQQGAEEMLRVHELLLVGNTWPEIAAYLSQNAEALKRRFYRHSKRTFHGTG